MLKKAAIDRRQSANTMLHSLMKTFETALKLDSWGQRLEAANEYEKFYTEYSSNIRKYSVEREAEEKLSNIVEQAKRRSAKLLIEPEVAIDGLAQTDNRSLQELQQGATLMQDMLGHHEKVMRRRRSSIAPLPGAATYYLLPPVKRMKAGKTYVSIKLEKIGFKDPKMFVDPFFTISVRDVDGDELGSEQNTHPSTEIHDKHIVYNISYHLQIPLEELPEGFAIFFEFKHYKEKQKKLSTKCYAFVELDEIRPGPATVELYQKPVDYKRKKICLLTQKPLYLHLNYKLQHG